MRFGYNRNTLAARLNHLFANENYCTFCGLYFAFASLATTMLKSAQCNHLVDHNLRKLNLKQLEMQQESSKFGAIGR